MENTKSGQVESLVTDLISLKQKLQSKGMIHSAQMVEETVKTLVRMSSETRDLRGKINRGEVSDKNDLRRHFASIALSSLLGNNSVVINGTPIAKYSIQVADEMVKELTGE